MKSRYIRIGGILVLIALGIWLNVKQSGLSIGNFERSLEIVLGLDLQGGLQVLLEVPSGFEASSQDMDVARQILENRSNGLGVSEVVFHRAVVPTRNAPKSNGSKFLYPRWSAKKYFNWLKKDCRTISGIRRGVRLSPRYCKACLFAKIAAMHIIARRHAHQRESFIIIAV